MRSGAFALSRKRGVHPHGTGDIALAYPERWDRDNDADLFGSDGDDNGLDNEYENVLWPK